MAFKYLVLIACDKQLALVDKGHAVGYKDEILENHGVIKCSKADYQNIEKGDIVSARVSDFGVEAMVSDRQAVARKYSGIVIDPTTLEEIMLFYVNREKKEWC